MSRILDDGCRLGRRRGTLAFGLVAVALLAGPTLQAQASEGWRHVRSLRTGGPGPNATTGAAYSSRTGDFYVLEPGIAAVRVVGPNGETRGSVALPLAPPRRPLEIAVDPRFDRLLVLESNRSLLAIPLRTEGLDLDTVSTLDLGRLHLERPRGLAVDPASGALIVLDALGPRLVRAVPDAGGAFETATPDSFELFHLRDEGLRGLAFDRTTGRLETLGSAGNRLYEVTQEGAVVAIRELAALRLRSPEGVLFAPSGDQTDDPAQLSLYVADAGDAASPGPVLQEIAFVEPAAVRIASSFASGLVRTTNTSLFSPPSPDPSGIAYVPASNTLLIVDGEVDECTPMTQPCSPLFQNVQEWETTLAGAVVSTASVIGFTDEPVGHAVNPSNRHLFYSDDNNANKTVFELNPGPDLTYHTGDDTLTSFVTNPFGDNDPEGLEYDSLNGVLLISDGVNSEVYRVSPGPNGIFDGVTGGGDDVVTQFDTAVHGLTDPEGIAMNQDTGQLYVVGHPVNQVFEFTAWGTFGTFVQTIDISAAAAIKPAGLAVGPGSNNPSETHLYIVDRGIDNNADPNENDGKLYEMTLLPGANLAITKTDGQTTVSPGATVTYTIVASNAGPAPAAGATLTDAFPAALLGVTWTCVGTAGGTCIASGSGNVNQLVNLPVGGSVTFTAVGTLSPAATGTLSNTATLTLPAGVSDPLGANNSATDIDTVVPDADLSVTKTDGQTTLIPGTTVTYTIVASNAVGPTPAIGATVADSFAAGLTGVAWTCVGANGGTCATSGSGNINQAVNLPVGGSVTFTATGTLVANPPSNLLTNTATVSVPSGKVDPVPGNNSATDVDEVVCGGQRVVVADGRVTASQIGASTTAWFQFVVKLEDSYSLELKNTTGGSSQPGTLTVFSGDDGCSGNTTLAVRNTATVDPASGVGAARVSFTALGTSATFRARLVNSGGSSIAYTFSLSDTTLYSPAWSTNGSFDTFYSFQNTTNSTVSGTLALLSSSGTPVASSPLTVPAGQTLSVNTLGLTLPRNQAGTARLTHDGPPGSIVAEAAIANFALVPAYVQPVRFQAVREAR